MKTLKEIADFLEEGIIECEPNTGCGRCDEVRECVSSLRSYINKESLIKESEYHKTRPCPYCNQIIYPLVDSNNWFYCSRCNARWLIQYE